MIRNQLLGFTLAVASAIPSIACRSDPSPQPAGATSASAAAATSATAPAQHLAAPVREGGALVRSAAGDALYLADEDHSAVRRIPLPLASDAAANADAGAPDAGATVTGAPPGMINISVPGAPAQVLALGDGRVLVTIRDPGLLLILKPDPQAVLAEEARVALPADAWGVAITPDEKTAIVSSAWTHQVSAVDLATKTKRWSIDVAREPRGIVVRADGAAAYVTHLVGSDITRIDDLSGTPKARAISLPPAPARAPSGKTLHASLGYAAALSDDGRRLYVARHALGALGSAAWFGAGTVDVLATATDAPLIPVRRGGMPVAETELLKLFVRDGRSEDIHVPLAPVAPFVQPRAIAYRKSAKTLLIAGEGNDRVVEVDALSPAPALQVLRAYRVGSDYRTTGDVGLGIANRCGSPTGIALSADEGKLYVYCRATFDLTTIELAPPADRAKVRDAPLVVVHIADDPLGKDAAMGRRFFLSGTDGVSSGGEGAGMGCAGCHPEGRDDGNVWHEAEVVRTRFHEELKHRNFIGEPENAPNAKGNKIGYPRQTPMLAGRVSAAGPYGWHAQNKDLGDRLAEGFSLHRWGRFSDVYYGDTKAPFVVRTQYLRAYLREGLVPPPREPRDLSPEEAQGKKVFLDPVVGCAKCHVPDPEYTDRTAYPLPKYPTMPGFEDEKDLQFKTPSLRFVGGTPPYFHDGHAGSLEEVVEKNNDRMGRTSQLSREDRDALVAFLRTL